MINSVTIAGYLGKDPQINYYNESVKATFSVAINYVVKGEEKTHWIPVECWGHSALFVSNYVKKGQFVVVMGRLEQSVWETENNEKKARIYIYATQVESPKQKDEIPF